MKEITLERSSLLDTKLMKFVKELEDRQLGLIAGGGDAPDAPLEHVETWGQGVCREDADREVGQGLEAGLRHTLVRLGPDELTHVGKQLVEDWVHGGRGESGDEIQRYNRNLYPEIESYLTLFNTHSDTISKILLARFVSSSSTVSMLTSSVLLWLVFRLAGGKDLLRDNFVTVGGRRVLP